MVAHYFKQQKPKSKIIILDNKERFSKQGLFQAGWEALYGDMIEWVPSSEGGQVERIDAKTRTAYSQGDLFTAEADVMNFIPRQKAGVIATATGLTDDNGWCPVDQATFESTIHPDIYVIGDSCIAGKMPKSGHSANNQGKVVAAAVVLKLNDQELVPPSTANTCYSLVAPDYGISVAAVYALQDGQLAGVKGAGGVSPSDAGADVRRLEAVYAEGWYKSITSDIWG
jgi:sulfide dehydrogenase [flavocytochrome c] flavoprotein subunit